MRNTCEFDVHLDENLPDIWEAVESATKYRYSYRVPPDESA